MAAGGGAIASGANSTSIGDSARATDNSVALGANSVADEDNAVSVGSQVNERRITNVASGVNTTDAVNMGQLQSGLNTLQSNVNSVALGASARITQNLKVKVGGGYASGGGATVGGGMSYQW